METPGPEILALCGAYNEISTRWNDANKRYSKEKSGARSHIYEEMKALDIERQEIFNKVKASADSEWFEYECPIDIVVWLRDQYYKSWKMSLGTGGTDDLKPEHMTTLDAKHFVPRYLNDKNIKADAPLLVWIKNYIANNGKIGP